MDISRGNQSVSPRTTVITYGTFDLLHYGHIRLLKRIVNYGDRVIVGLSTDKFNQEKGKSCLQSYRLRKKVIESLSIVDKVIPERNWFQKERDIRRYKADILIMGDDWKGMFDDLPCKVKYLPRTKNISSSELRQWLS